jgi:hypothetical protein
VANSLSLVGSLVDAVFFSDFLWQPKILNKKQARAVFVVIKVAGCHQSHDNLAFAAFCLTQFSMKTSSKYAIGPFLIQ